MRKGLEFAPQQMPGTQSQLGGLVGGRGRKTRRNGLELRIYTHAPPSTLTHTHAPPSTLTCKPKANTYILTIQIFLDLSKCIPLRGQRPPNCTPQQQEFSSRYWDHLFVYTSCCYYVDIQNGERDTIMSNTIDNRGYLFVSCVDMHMARSSFVLKHTTRVCMYF